MRKSKVVIVEDESIVAEDLKSSLEKIGYYIPAIFASGEELLE
jgi:CheY-like chemotaxis protein